MMLFVSILIPIRNEEYNVERCLQTVLLQDYPQDKIEILITDGMSTDNTREIIRKYQEVHPNVQMLDNPGKIVPTGMNIALQQARGDFIIRVDGHTIIASDYVSNCVETLQRTEADNVGGCMTATGTNLFGEAVAIATSTPFGIGGGRFHYSNKEEWVDSVYMGAWKRSVFKKIGLFDEELVRDQDDEFNYRLRAVGGKILLSPKIKSIYTVRSNPKALWKQYFQYGYYKVRVLQKHPAQMSPRQFVPPLFVLSLLVSSILALTTNGGWILLAAVAGSYLVTNLGASLITVARKGWKHLPLLPVTYAIIHLSYGLGFLAGLLKFWNRWGDKIGKVPSFETHLIEKREQ